MRYEMAHATIFTRHRCPLFAVLLGALACGDGATTPASATGANRAAGETSLPAPPNSGAAPTPGPPETPATPSAAATNGAAEGVAPNPVLGAQSPSPSAG